MCMQQIYVHNMESCYFGSPAQIFLFLQYSWSHLETKNCALTALTLKFLSREGPPDMSSIAPPNPKSCSRSSYTQILIIGCDPALGGVLHTFWVSKHNFGEFIFEKLQMRQLDPLHTKTIKIP